jgi:hypothetical protein
LWFWKKQYTECRVALTALFGDWSKPIIQGIRIGVGVDNVSVPPGFVFAVVVAAGVVPQYIFRDFDLLKMVIEYDVSGLAANFSNSNLDSFSLILVADNVPIGLWGGLCFLVNVWLDAPKAETTMMVMTATPMARVATVFAPNMVTTIWRISTFCAQCTALHGNDELKINAWNWYRVSI